MRRRSLRGRRLRLRCVSLECRSFGIGSWTPAVTPQRLKPRLTDGYVWRGWKPRQFKASSKNRAHLQSQSPKLEFFRSPRTHNPEALRLLAIPERTAEAAAGMVPVSVHGG